MTPPSIALRAPRSHRVPVKPARIALVAYTLGGCAALLVAISVAPPSLAMMVAVSAFVGIGVWMFRTERYEHTLPVLMVYLGAVDGFAKLSLGGNMVTLGRDALLYAITIGAVARWTLRREAVRVPPMTGWIVLFVGLIVAELFNPGTAGTLHGLAGMRPHLEFVPLFFFGYGVMQSKPLLRGFLLILLVLGAANGVVSLIQFNESPSQVASWGPGYAARINGGTGQGGRTFQDSSGQTRVRPFGLQSDAGGGGYTGMLAVPAAIVLLGPLRRRRTLLICVACAVGTTLAVVASEGRGVVLTTFATLFAFVGLSVVGKRLIPTLVGVLFAGAAVLAIVSVLSSSTLSRYSSITPTNVLTTAQQSRGDSVTNVFPRYLGRYPFGAGLGSAGPATGLYRQGDSGLNGETEFTFLVVEGGVALVLLVLGFHIRIMMLAIRRIRSAIDAELRVLLAAVAAPLFGIFFTYFSGPATSTSPMSPYLWFVSGVIVYWCVSARHGSAKSPFPASDANRSTLSFA